MIGIFQNRVRQTHWQRVKNADNVWHENKQGDEKTGIRKEGGIGKRGLIRVSSKSTAIWGQK